MGGGRRSFSLKNRRLPYLAEHSARERRDWPPKTAGANASGGDGGGGGGGGGEEEAAAGRLTAPTNSSTKSAKLLRPLLCVVGVTGTLFGGLVGGEGGVT